MHEKELIEQDSELKDQLFPPLNKLEKKLLWMIVLSIGTIFLLNP